MTDRRPSTPSEILREEFLTPNNITQDELAKAMGVSRFRVNEIINGRRALTSETAVLLGKALGTSARFWMNLQVAVDLFDADRKLGDAVASAHCLLAASPSDFVVEMPLT
jgi:addiction module HigA family antidote